jgi:L-ascorbate metabolism protein UlaG (beta-lactamase superfamily)
MKRHCTFASTALVCLCLAACSEVNLKHSFDPYSPAQTYQTADSQRPGLQVQFFGTSTILFSDGEHSILIDGFFSRPSWPKLALTNIKPDPGEIKFALSNMAVRKINAILVSHSHHDHAMDSGIVAQRTNAVIYGSESTLNIARGQSTPEHQLNLLRVCDPLTIGKFHITVFDTPHSSNPINPGFIYQPLTSPTHYSNYKMAEVFSFFLDHPLGKILIVPSANYKPNAFDGVRADIIILGIGLLGKQPEKFTQNYWKEVVSSTGARLVFPVHWDDITKSLKEPLVPIPYYLDDVSLTIRRLQKLAADDDVAMKFLPPLMTVTLPAQHSNNPQ